MCAHEEMFFGMKTRALLVCGLLVLLGLSVSAQGLQASEGIKSYGIIEYSERTQSVIIKRYTATFSFKDTDAETVAQLFDMCQAWTPAAEKIRQVHQIRQDFKALLYRNIRAIYNYREDEWQTALDNDWILKDENGQLVYSTKWPNNYMADIGNPEYQTWLANWTKENIDQYGFDGVFADRSLSAWAAEHFWGSSAQPINPRTGDFWTDAEVRQALVEVHKEIKNALGSKLLVCNGIGRGEFFWRRYDGYVEVVTASPLDGIMSEGLWYQYQGEWMSEEQWLESLDFLTWIQDNFLLGRSERVFVPLCKLQGASGNSYPLPPEATEEQLLTYAFASTLLGVKTNQNYLGTIADVDFITQVLQPLHNIDIGTPVDDYYVIEGTHVYARDFSKVKVLVNPTSISYVIDLQGTFETIQGEILTEITMESHTGLILIKGESS